MAKRDRHIGESMARIRNPQAYEDGQWDLDLFAGCFGDTNIRMSDGDGEAERKGSVLFTEFKRPGVPVSLGQSLLFRAKSAHPLFFQMVVEGERHEPERFCFWTAKGPGEWRPCDLDVLRGRVAAWFAWADRRGQRR